MTPQAERLAEVLRTGVAVGRFPSYVASATMPSSHALADYLLGLPGFRDLGLGRWQGVTADAVINEALSAVVPVWMEPEFTLLFDGVKVAAERQRGESWGKIIGGAALSLLGGLVIRETVKSLR